MAKKSFLNTLLDSKNTSSSKRFITLVIAAHFIFTAFLVSFFAFYVILFLPKGKVEPALLEVLTKILEWDFYIVLAGLGLITTENFGQMMVEKVKAVVAGNIATSNPTKDAIGKVDDVVAESSSTTPENLDSRTELPT